MKLVVDIDDFIAKGALDRLKGEHQFICAVLRFYGATLFEYVP